jgi:sugar transferase (PEP-CTERM/EpsH1 system associated)
MNKSGKILFISPQLPYPLNVGSKIRIYNLLKSYSAKHEVTLICFTQNAEESEYLHNVRNVCTKVRGIPIETAYMRNQSPYKVGRVLSRLLAPLPFSIKSFVSPEMTTEIMAEMKAEDYDVLHVEKIFMASYALGIAGGRKAKANMLTLLDIDDIESRKMKQLARLSAVSSGKCLKYLDYMKLKYYEKTVFNQYSCCFVCSERDKELLTAEGLSANIEVIPNGIDITNNECRESSPNYENIILFLGAMNYEPNEDAAVYFAKRIFPLLKRRVKTAKFVIAGKDPTDRIRKLHNGNDICVTGYVENVKKLFSECTIFVVPIRAGGGTRIKILEAMSMKKPVVSTSIGCEGIEVLDGEHILKADNPEHFAAQCMDLLFDKHKRDIIAFNARSLVAEKYSWSAIGDKLNSFLATSLEERRCSAQS